MTPEFRVSYPNVFKSKKNDLNGKEEYSLVALFPKGADLTKLVEAAKQAIEDKWGANKPANLRSPFRKQEDRAKLDEVSGKKVLPSGMEEGATYLNLKSEQRPGLVDQTVQDILDTSQFYAGCYARATIRAYAYDAKGNKGVAFGLINIQKTRDGDPFGNRTKAQDDFAPIEGANLSAQPASATDLFN